MRSLTRILTTLAPVALLALLAACGSSNNSSSNSNIRLVNASKTATLTLALNGGNQFTNIAASSASPYGSINSGAYTLTVSASGGSLAAATQNVSLSGNNQYYTVLAYDRDGAVTVSTISENQGVPSNGYGSFGVINVSQDSGPLDIYVVAAGTTSLVGLPTTFSYVGNSPNPSTTSLIAGTYTVFATAANVPTDVRLRLPSVTIANGQILMLALTSTTGGALVNGVLLNQASSVQMAPNTTARVRAVSGLPTSPAIPVIATVGTTTLSTVYAPNANPYTVVTGGQSAYTISVNGTAVGSVPAATFTAGGDYTILVYGTAVTPIVSVFTDNNQSPTGFNANLRLINAGVNVAGGLTMYDNGVQVANSVAYGAASPYFGVAPSTSTILSVIEPGQTPVPTSVSIASTQAVYSVFVFDSTLATTLVRDR